MDGNAAATADRAREPGDDVVADRGRGAPGEGNSLRLAEEIARAPERAVAWPEVVTPLADAVSLVYREQRGGTRDSAEPCRRAGQALGREVEQPERPIRERRKHTRTLLRSQSAVQRGGPNSARAGRGDLILHQ